MIIKVCPFCGKEFEAERNRQKYCSIKCKVNSQIKNYEPKKCEGCGKLFINKKHPNSRYCSRKCAYISKDGKRALICDFCGKEFFKFPSLVKDYEKHYCSNECRSMASRKNDKIYYENDYAYLLLTKNNITKKVLFDTEDVEKIKKYKWHLHLRKKDMRYDVCTNTHGKHNERKYLFMTRYLMSCPDNLVVDHINHNTLDNRKCNLRNVTIFENNKNKSPFTK